MRGNQPSGPCSGERELLRQWIVNWIGEEGKAWRLSHEDVRHSIVRPLLSLAEEVGEEALAARAAKRLRGLLIGYRSHKDYGFAHILEWFPAASRADPALWRTVGWKVRHLCDLCEQRDGDNRLQGLSAPQWSAALGCGPGDWWALVQVTASLGVGDHWYYRTGRQLIEGVVEAVDSGRTIPCDDLPVIWSLGLAFSYWHDEQDNNILRLFREALRQVPGTLPEQAASSHCTREDDPE